MKFRLTFTRTEGMVRKALVEADSVEDALALTTGEIDDPDWEGEWETLWGNEDMDLEEVADGRDD